MNVSGLFKVSMVATALSLVGCGGDLNITPTNIDNSVDNLVYFSVPRSINEPI